MFPIFTISTVKTVILYLIAEMGKHIDMLALSQHTEVLSLPLPNTLKCSLSLSPTH
jgi:hypothetical protein